MSRPRRLALPALSLGLLAPASFGQSVLFTFDGDSAGDLFAESGNNCGPRPSTPPGHEQGVQG